MRASVSGSVEGTELMVKRMVFSSSIGTAHTAVSIQGSPFCGPGETQKGVGSGADCCLRELDGTHVILGEAYARREHCHAVAVHTVDQRMAKGNPPAGVDRTGETQRRKRVDDAGSAQADGLLVADDLERELPVGELDTLDCTVRRAHAAGNVAALERRT